MRVRDSGGTGAGPPASAARLTLTPADGSTNVKPGRPAAVQVSRGTIDDVILTQGFDPVSGRFNAAHTTWHTTWALRPGREYTLIATAIDAKQRAVTRSITFRTLRPAHTFQAQVFEGYHQTYGVGMPIILTFSRPVRHRAAVERSIQLWTSKPVTGAWYWDTNTSLVFRPRSYWPENTRVHFVAHFAGLEASPGVYGTADLVQSFRIGSSLIAVVNTASHYAKIYYRRKLFGNWPVSTGAPGDD
jgi:hypothetical protein